MKQFKKSKILQQNKLKNLKKIKKNKKKLKSNKKQKK